LELTNQNRNKLILAGLMGLVAGIILGLFYGYVINPVKWVDAPMENTRADIQEDYLRMSIDSYKLYFDQAKAYERWLELGDAGPATLAKVMASPEAQGLDAINRYKSLVTLQDAVTQYNACGSAQGTSNKLCIYLWGGTMSFVAVLGVFLYYRIRQQDFMPSSPRTSSPKVKDLVDEAPDIILDNSPSLFHTMTTFVMGDDLFDESFTIDSPNGDFLGECGVGIVNTINDKTPKMVNAFDIWLFDKNEINTKSIVLMTERAYSNDILRTQLESKGLPILAKVGEETLLKTDNLRMSVRIVDMLHDGSDPLKSEFFQRLSLEIFIRPEK